MAELLRDSFHGADPDSYQPGFHESKGSQAVEFYWNPVREKDYCKITFPGDRQKIWNQPVRAVDKQRYHRQWTLYQEGKDQNSGQTMLTAWGEIDPGSISVYQMMHISTVEQLAIVSDGNIQNFPPGTGVLARRHREMANAYLQKKQQSAGFEQAMDAAQESQRMAQEALKDKADLQRQIEELKASMPKAAKQFPKFVKGIGRAATYELSDGSEVVGKKAAQEAQALLEH